MESQLFFFSKRGGILATLSGNFWYLPELEPRALTPMEVFSAIATFSKKKKRWEKAHGAVPVWLPGHSLARGIWATCSRDVQDSEVQKTTCPWRVTVSFQLLPRRGCAPDMFGGQAMRWGLAVGKYPPCVFLLAVILWLETEAAGLTDLGSLRLEGIMNTPGRAQGTWEFLKHSSSPFWAP